MIVVVLVEDQPKLRKQQVAALRPLVQEELMQLEPQKLPDPFAPLASSLLFQTLSHLLSSSAHG